MTRRAAASVIGAGSLLLASCGYHVGGKADLLPKAVQTISIPAFWTSSNRYTLSDKLPRDIGREFVARTRFTVVNNPAEADALLNGTINSAFVAPQIYDPSSGKATSVQFIVVLTIKLVERRTGRILFSRAGWALRQNYEVAVDPHQFFNESSPALDRLSRDMARDLVSSIVENF